MTPLQLRNRRSQVEITAVAPESDAGPMCSVCGRIARLAPAPIALTVEAAAWYRLLSKHITRLRVTCPVHDLGTLAERLAEVGPPSDPSARVVYDHVQQLLLTPRILRTGNGQRVPTLPLKDVLAVLLPGTAALLSVALAVQVWCRVTGRQLVHEKMNRATVVAVMQQVPSVEPYIQHLHRKGWSSLAQMFHPNTLDAAKKDPALRGLFGGATTYWNATVDTLEVVQ